MPSPSGEKPRARRPANKRKRRASMHEYAKRYRAAHREKIRARNKAYFKAHPGYWKKWYAAHREERIVYKRKWRKKQRAKWKRV